MRVYCRSQMTSQRVKKSRRTREEVEWRDCCSLHAVTSSVIYYSTHTRKNVIYFFYTIKIQMVYWRIFGAWKKTKTSLQTWIIWKCPQKSRYCIHVKCYSLYLRKRNLSLSQICNLVEVEGVQVLALLQN